MIKWWFAPFLEEAEVTGWADNRTVQEPGQDYWSDANIKAGLIWSKHPGLDLVRGGVGTPIYSISSGYVLEAMECPVGASGNFGGWESGTRVAITAGKYKGKPSAWGYNHLNSFVVNKGDWVEAGQLIGYMGNTGDSKGAHLHLVFYVGTPGVDMKNYDPLPFLDGRSVTIPDSPPAPPSVAFNMPIIARFRNTEKNIINLRMSPDKDSADIGDIKPGDEFEISEIYDNPSQGIIFGNTGKGYAALTYQGAVWCTPIAPVAVVDLTQQLAEADNEIVRLDALVDEITLSNNKLMDANVSLTGTVVDFSNRLNEIKARCP
jgi:hypothetical protein